jgi:hypothetical protein
LPRFGDFFVLKGTDFRCYILEPVPDVPLVRLWGSIGTRIPIWDTTGHVSDYILLHSFPIILSFNPGYCFAILSVMLTCGRDFLSKFL